MNQLRVVVLENVYSNWHNPFVVKLFNRIIALKKNGFASRFSSLYAPVDKSDFHCVHLSLCKEVDQELYPICTVRSISFEQCEKYAFPFTGATVADSSRSPDHIKAVLNFVEEAKGQNRSISYSSAFAIEPSLKKEERKMAIDFLVPLFAFYHIHWRVDRSLAIGSCRTKTDQLYHDMGLLPIKLNGTPLPPVELASCQNEKFEIQALTEITDYCKNMARENLHFWKNRIHITDLELMNHAVEDYLVAADGIAKMSA